MVLKVEVRTPGTVLVGRSTLLRRFGVPTGGPFDQESAALANALCGNQSDASVLEISISEVCLSLEDGNDHGLIAAVGAGWGSRLRILSGQTIFVGPRGGERVYLAILGGFGSQQNHAPIEPVHLSIGEHRYALATTNNNDIQLSDSLLSLNRHQVSMIPGPHYSELGAPTSIRAKIGNSRSRAGVRLDAGREPHSIELKSEPAQPGTVQVTPSGQILVTGPDGPTTGGYPKLGYIYAADFDKVGQWTLGDKVEILTGNIDEAIALRRKTQQALTLKCDLIRRVLFDKTVDEPSKFTWFNNS